MRTHSQRLLSMVLALSMLLTFLPVSAFAESTSSTGLQELNNDDTYTDPSNNDKYEYTLNPDDNTATLTKFTGTNADVPSSVTTSDGKTYRVTTIGIYAFTDPDHTFNTTLQSVNLPDSIQTIEEGAFHGCSSLYNITLPENLIEVKAGAFFSASLKTIEWPKSLTTVGYRAFYMTDSHLQPIPIETIIYRGTEDEWKELESSQNFATTNPQLVPKNTEDAEDAKGVDLHCAHTVTFNKNGHGDPEEKLVQYGEKATKPRKDPKADGYTFKGWYTADEGGDPFDFTAEITEDKTAYAQWEKETTPEKPDKPTTPEQPGTTTPTTPPESTDKPTDKPNEPNPPESTDKPDNNKPGTPEKPNEPTTPEAPAVEEDDTAAIGYAAAAVTAAFVGWGAYRIGSEVYLKYLLPKDVLLPQNRIQLAELLWEDAGRPAPADAAAYTDVDADDADAQQAARWAVENGLLTLPDTEKPEEFAPYRSVSYAKSARAWNQAQQLKENAAAR